MKVLVVEDESPAAQNLVALIHQYDEKIQVLDQLDTIESTVDFLINNPAPDLIFLDIHLADGKSFDIFDEITIESPVIFTTAYDQYAIRAFKHNSVDYLLKPVKYEELAASIEKFKKIYQSDPGYNFKKELNSISELISGQKKIFKSRFLVKAGKLIKTIMVDDIAYFHADQRIVFLTTKDGKNYPLDYTLDEVEQMIDHQHFHRVHRKAIIGIDAIREILPYFKGRVKIYLNPEYSEGLVVSSERTPLFKEWLNH